MAAELMVNGRVGWTDEGIAVARRLRRNQPRLGMLVLSQYLESHYATSLLTDTPELAGYLLKDRVSDVAVLVDALRRVVEGECVVEPTIVARLMRPWTASGPFDRLSQREREVLALMAEGRSNAAISSMLGWASARSRHTCARSSRSWICRRRPTITAACWPWCGTCKLAVVEPTKRGESVRRCAGPASSPCPGTVCRSLAEGVQGDWDRGWPRPGSPVAHVPPSERRLHRPSRPVGTEGQAPEAGDPGPNCILVDAHLVWHLTASDDERASFRPGGDATFEPGGSSECCRAARGGHNLLKAERQGWATK